MTRINLIATNLILAAFHLIVGPPVLLAAICIAAVYAVEGR